MTKSLEGFSGYSLPPFKRLGVFFAGIWQDFFLIFLGEQSASGSVFGPLKSNYLTQNLCNFYQTAILPHFTVQKIEAKMDCWGQKTGSNFWSSWSPQLILSPEKCLEKVQKNSSCRFHDEDAVWFSSIKNEPMMMTGSQIILVQKKWWGNYAQGIPGYHIPSPEKYNEPVVNFEIGRTGSR